MKKILIGISIIVFASMYLFYFQSKEVFERVTEVVQPLTTVVNITEQPTDIDVRIVIKTPGSESIYRDEITLSSKELKIYYGKNYRNVEGYQNVTIKANSKLFKKKKIIKVLSNADIRIKGMSNPYKGSFYIYKTSKGLVTVNQVSMDDYVAGVISSEMNEDFPIEALKAQAICARTYIYDSNPEIYKKYKANGDDSISYQVYNKIKPGTNCIEAAKSTSGMIITFDGKPIDAFYFSTSCGYTTNYKIWGDTKLDYLKKTCLTDKKNNDKFKKFIKSKPKAYEDDYPYYRWNIYLTKNQIENSVWNYYGINIGKLKSVKVQKRGAGGIASQVLIKGSKKEILITNQNEIRKVLCSTYSSITLNDGLSTSQMSMLPSAFICIDRVVKNGSFKGVKIYGGGFGHGSGMSQNAAKEMALKGIKYNDILNTFYKNIEICNINSKEITLQ